MSKKNDRIMSIQIFLKEMFVLYVKKWIALS